MDSSTYFSIYSKTSYLSKKRAPPLTSVFESLKSDFQWKNFARVSKILRRLTKISFSVIQHAFFFCVSNSLKHLFENLTLYNIIRTITLNILLVFPIILFPQPFFTSKIHHHALFYNQASVPDNL